MWNEGMSKNQQKLKNNNIQTGRFSSTDAAAYKIDIT